MKIHRFITSFELEGEKNILIEDAKVVHHILHVLRLKKNEEIVVCDGNGTDFLITLQTIEKKKIQGILLKKTTKEKSDILLHGYISLIKKDNFELALQKMVELGISKITPIYTNRSIQKEYNKDRLHDIIREATEQSGQSYLPVLNSALSLKEALKESKEIYQETIVFHQEGMLYKNTHAKNIAYFIGPEGGWTDEEIKEMEKNNTNIYTLGNTTLRAETAIIVATYELHKNI